MIPLGEFIKKVLFTVDVIKYSDWREPAWETKIVGSIPSAPGIYSDSIVHEFNVGLSLTGLSRKYLGTQSDF